MLVHIRDKFRAEVQTEMQQVSDALTSGKAADFADYRRMVGVLVGLKKSLDAMDAVYKRLNDDEGD